MLEHYPEAERFLPGETIIMYWNYDPFHWPRPNAFDQLVRGGHGVIGASGARFGSHNNTMFQFGAAMRGIAAMANLCRHYACDGVLVTDWTKAVATDLTLPCLVYGAVCAWGGSAGLDDFAGRFARLHFGREWDWQRVYSILSPPVPYCEDAGAHQADNVDRFDLSARSFRERVIDYTRQTSPTGGALREGRRNVREEVVASLHEAARRAEVAGQLLLGSVAGAADAPDLTGHGLWAHLDVARRTHAHAARLGLALDEAVRLLKFPAPDDADRRRTVADELEALTAAADTLRRECRSLLERTTFAPVAARIGDLKFPAEASAILRSMSADLRAGVHRSTLLAT
jgi:hypothetical protein